MAAYARQGDLVSALATFADLKTHSALGEGGLLVACKEARAGKTALARAELVEVRAEWLARVAQNAQSSLDYDLLGLARAQQLSGDGHEAQQTMSHSKSTDAHAEFASFIQSPAPDIHPMEGPFLFVFEDYLKMSLPEEECWFPELRISDLLKIGIDGFSFAEKSDLCSDTDLTHCLALIKNAAPSTSSGRYEDLRRFVDTLSDASNFLRER